MNDLEKKINYSSLISVLSELDGLAHHMWSLSLYRMDYSFFPPIFFCIKTGWLSPVGLGLLTSFGDIPGTG